MITDGILLLRSLRGPTSMMDVYSHAEKLGFKNLPTLGDAEDTDSFSNWLNSIGLSIYKTIESEKSANLFTLQCIPTKEDQLFSTHCKKIYEADDSLTAITKIVLTPDERSQMDLLMPMSPF